MENVTFRQANEADAPAIWKILQDGIAKRKAEGSAQWQNGYPNPETVKNDIAMKHNYVWEKNGNVVATAGLIFNYEPAYTNIDGAWLSNADFIVVHRVAVSSEIAQKGFGGQIMQDIEQFARQNEIPSIKMDTNFDNIAMLRLAEKHGYRHCGKVTVNGGERLAFEKLITL